jgi:hypothetical protein
MTLRTLWTVALAIVGTTLASVAPALTIPVTNNADTGPGSFREAAAMASADPTIDSIVFDRGLGTIELSIANGSVVYAGSQALSIFGSDASITTQAGGTFDLFRSSGGGDLWLSDLVFVGGGANGIAVHVPAGATTALLTVLHHVTVADNADYGLLIEDQVDEADAGVALYVTHSTVTGNGTPIGRIVRINGRVDRIGRYQTFGLASVPRHQRRSATIILPDNSSPIRGG